jgi:PEP-CTERM/exosortase A-associated glycosyltransferase
VSFRVLHVLDHSWPVLDGYAQRSRSIVTAQSQLGFYPSVLTSPLHQVDDPSAPAESIFEEIRYIRTSERNGLAGLAIQKRFPILRELAVISRLRKRIESVLRSENFDIVHAHSPALCGMAAGLAARSCNVPFVYEIRAFWEDGAVDQSRDTETSLRYRLSKSLETNVVQRANAVVGIARPILNDLEGRGVSPAKLFLVPNGVDVARFSSRPRDASLAAELGLDGVRTLGFLGTLFLWEGIAWLISAAEELHKRGVVFKLLIVGDGPDAENVKNAIQKAGAQSYISFLGRVPNDQVERYYSLMDIMLYPRRSIRLTELVTPLKPLEAMALGKPVLGSGVGGIRELVEPEATGLLFEPGNIDSFCHETTRLLMDEELGRRLGSQARQMIVEEKDWKTIVERYRGVYEFARSRHVKL